MNIAKRAVNGILRRVGLELHRASSGLVSDNRLIEFFGMLKAMGFDPKTIYDIGANRGLWTMSVLGVFPLASYTLFEPQAHLGKEIQGIIQKHPNVQWRHAAVSDACGTAEFAEYEWDVCSRLASDVDPEWDDQGKRVKVETTTVDEEVKKTGRIPDLLKIDAEGHDFAVLNGAKSVLGKTPVILVEAAVCCPAMDNTVLKVIQRMHDEGYSLAGIVDLNEFHMPGKSMRGILWLVDLAFCITGGELFAKLQEPA